MQTRVKTMTEREMKVCRNFCQNFNLEVWANIQKRWERSTRLERWQRSKTCQTFLTFHLIYIYRYLADKQLLFLTVNIFIHWIFNVIFNPVHHHCHLFTDFYKRFTCVEFKPFFIARKSNTFIFWRACLLVVPAGFDPRTYNIKTLHFNSSVDNVPSSPVFQTSKKLWNTPCLPLKDNKTLWKYFRGCMGVLR